MGSGGNIESDELKISYSGENIEMIFFKVIVEERGIEEDIEICLNE